MIMEEVEEAQGEGAIKKFSLKRQVFMGIVKEGAEVGLAAEAEINKIIITRLRVIIQLSKLIVNLK